MANNNIFKNMKTRTKLIASFLLVTVLFVLLAIFSAYTTSSTINGYDFTINNVIGGAFHY